MNSDKENAIKMKTRRNDEAAGRKRSTINSIRTSNMQNGNNASNKRGKKVRLGKVTNILQRVGEDSTDDEVSIQPDIFDSSNAKHHSNLYSIGPNQLLQPTSSNVDKKSFDKNDDGTDQDEEDHEMNIVKSSNIESKKNKQEILGKNTLSILHAYVRDTLFRQKKIIDFRGNDLDTNGEIMKKCCTILEFPIDNVINNCAFMNECRSQIMKTINARRNYVKRQLAIVMTDLMQKDQFFDLDNMARFYSVHYEHTQEVKDAWYKFCYNCLPTVSKQWRDAVSSEKLHLKTNMYKCVTISDDALVRWLMNLWIPHLLKRKENGWESTDKSLGKGPHESLEKRNDFVKWYGIIRDCRKDPHLAFRWNDLFWKEVEIRHAEKFKRMSLRANNTTVKTLSTNMLPLPAGLDDLEDPILMERPCSPTIGAIPDNCLSGVEEIVGI